MLPVGKKHSNMQHSMLMKAVDNEDVEQVMKILESCSSMDEIDGKAMMLTTRVGTAMMEAARGNGEGGNDYNKILKLFWKSYKRVTCGNRKQMESILLDTDARKGWNVLMHSARCGDEQNLKLVLRFYKEIFGECLWLNAEIRDSIYSMDVNSTVKDLIIKEIFNGNIEYTIPTRRKRSCTMKKKNVQYKDVQERPSTSPNSSNVEKLKRINIDSSHNDSNKDEQSTINIIELLGDSDSEENDNVGNLDKTLHENTYIKWCKGKIIDDRSSSLKVVRNMGNGQKNLTHTDQGLPGEGCSFDVPHCKNIQTENCALAEEMQNKISLVEEVSRLRSERDSAIERERSALEQIKKLKAALRHFL